MIDRPVFLKQLSRAVRRSPITALIGPRQCGKTTLARMFAKAKTTVFFDLESQLDLNRLQNPQLMLGSLRGLVIIDEIQAMPELFAVLRVLVDRPENKTRFLILGSASPDLVKNASETLAGRVEFALVLFLPLPMKIVSRGARRSSTPSWPGISRSSVSRFRLRPCADSGPCWLITMVKSGMPRNLAAP